MMFEPQSVVHYRLGTTITADDIGLFCWRWDMRNVLGGYKYFERKWGIDITEHGNFKNFLMNYNNQVGCLPRCFRSEWALGADRILKRVVWRVKSLAASGVGFGFACGQSAPDITTGPTIRSEQPINR